MSAVKIQREETRARRLWMRVLLGLWLAWLAAMAVMSRAEWNVPRSEHVPGGAPSARAGDDGQRQARDNPARRY